MDQLCQIVVKTMPNGGNAIVIRSEKGVVVYDFSHWSLGIFSHNKLNITLNGTVGIAFGIVDP